MSDMSPPNFAQWGPVGTTIAGIILAIKYFATMNDLSNLENRIEDKYLTKEEASNKYVTKEAINQALELIRKDIGYIINRLDEIFNKKSL